MRGGATENFEGDWHPERIVVLEFQQLTVQKNGGTQIFIPMRNQSGNGLQAQK